MTPPRAIPPGSTVLASSPRCQREIRPGVSVETGPAHWTIAGRTWLPDAVRRGTAASVTAPDSDVIPFREAVRAWFAISLQTFGGPAGQIAVMQRTLVDEKRWIGQQRFLHALSYCTLLPGPEAQQLAIYVGWLLNGLKGGLVAGTLFVLPGVVALLGLSAVYVSAGDSTLV